MNKCFFDNKVFVIRTQPQYLIATYGTSGGVLSSNTGSHAAPTLSGGTDTLFSALESLLRAFNAGAFNAGIVSDSVFDSHPLLGWIVKPGDRVVVKPNLIRQSHLSRESEWDYVVTHGSVIKTVVDHVLAALGGRGEVIIADSPQTDSDFGEIVKRNGLWDIVESYKREGLPVRLLDLREEQWLGDNGVIRGKKKLPGDPEGYVTIDLGKDSAFHDYKGNGRFYGAYYDTEDTMRFHSQEEGRHAYVVSRTCLDCDVFINLPKMKTHKKTGITLSMKNLVGICTHKNSLPHYSLGTPDTGGDEYPASGLAQKTLTLAARVFRESLLRFGSVIAPLARIAKRAVDGRLPEEIRRVRSGNWYGNDTIWRTVVDLNRILLWFDGDGKPRKVPRRYLTIVNGIIAEEGEGPMEPDPKPVGLLFGGTNPVAVDAVGARLMGFDPYAIPMLTGALRQESFPIWDKELTLDDIIVHSLGLEGFEGRLGDIKHPGFGFVPSIGWRGHIEFRG